ncbi:MAG: V-type ATP synthase subunit K [Lentisphaerae bacterium]|nr:V-type ATP synthase subunit K [Lentisphaerota bacterium]
MDPEVQTQVIASLGKLAAALSLCITAMGSTMGTGIAGMAAAGAWKSCYVRNRIAPFMLVAFVGLPLTQTIYGMIVMNATLRSIEANPTGIVLPIGGLIAGTAMGLTSWLKGRAGATAAIALAETGKGFVNYLMVLGVVETVSLFVMVFVAKAVT